MLGAQKIHDFALERAFVEFLILNVSENVRNGVRVKLWMIEVMIDESRPPLR